MRPARRREEAREGTEIEAQPETANVATRTAAAGAPDFLAGGGEAGERIRAVDWSATSLGAPESWPQSLKTIVRVLLDSRYAMWMLWGPDLTFFCNDAYLPTVGIKRDWVIGARSDKVWEEIWPDIGPRIARVLEHGQATWDEGLLLFLERSGFSEETYHTFSYSPVYDDRSRIAGMLCVVTEVTERVISERRLRALRDLAGRSRGIDSVVETCERACEVLATYPLDVPFAALYLLDEAGDRRAHRVASTPDADPSALPATLELGDAGWLAKLAETERPVELDGLGSRGPTVTPQPWPDLVRKAFAVPLKGARQHGLAGFLVAGLSPRRPLDEAYESFVGLVGKQIDSAIGEAQAYEAERRRAEALAELDRAKTTFFSNVSHEFRTPLTLMLGPLEAAVAAADTPPRLREALVLAHRNAERLQKLVNSLLDFSRIEAGRVRASYEPTDVCALTRDLASNFRSAMERAGLAFTVDCETLDEPLFVDREMWEKIVLNLLSNALKFTLEGRVSLSLVREGHSAVLRVADTGVGMPEHELPRLFERFYRIEGVEGRTHEGTGIGLALVQELVRLHGGTIDAQSELGRGTEFRVRIPFGKAHLPPERVHGHRRPAPSGGAAPAFVQEALRWLQDDGAAADVALAQAAPAERDDRFAKTFGARIVLADDNADMRSYLTALLAPYYSVEAVPDGEAALAAARRARPDLVVTDVMMPRLDGFELLSAIRADDELRRVPVVLLSARAGEESRIEGLGAGADDYLTKPFSARELLARVGALLELDYMRRTGEQAFRRRSAQYETLFQEAPLGVYLVDADFKIREANPTAFSTFGDIPDLIGRNFADVIRSLSPQAPADEILGRFRRTLETGEPYFSSEHVQPRLDRGVTEYYEWQINRIPLPDGGYGVVCYFRDISAHVHARARLETADRQKDEFLAMLAHELRNPLAPLRNAAEVLSRSTSPEGERTRTLVEIVQRQVTNLSRLVDDLLDVSRITQGRIELRRRSVQLTEVIGHALEIVDPLFRERKHRVLVTGHAPLRVNGDAERLVQCVANVLTNAAKYTDRGGRIEVGLREDGTEAVITIKDDGAGIAADLLPHVFDLFVQSTRTLDRSLGGLGIGLSVVKRLVEMHGGRVLAASDGVGRGATFEIRLPLLEADDRPSAEAWRPQTPPSRILIVDDNQDAADSLAMMLALDGHEVRQTYAGAPALACLREFRPDVILLDIGLPGMDGYEVARRIREQPDGASIRLIALTGYGQESDKSRTRAAGFDEHLVKPVELRNLHHALAGASARH